MKRLLLIVFVLSSIIFLALLVSRMGNSSPGGNPRGTPTPTGSPSTPPPVTNNATDMLALVTAGLTSALSFIGMISTTVIGWRKEQREARTSELELERQRLELERQRLEFERAKLQGKSDKPNGT